MGIQGYGYNKSVDWWTLGILIYEFMTGRTPFTDSNKMIMCRKIVEGIHNVHFLRSNITIDCQAVIMGLCHRKPDERIPMQSNGLVRFQQMRWYYRMNWDGLTTGKVIPPFVPHVESIEDYSNYY